MDVLHQGRLAAPLLDIEQMRAERDTDLERLDPGVTRLMNSHTYHVSLSEKLWNLKQALIGASRLPNPVEGPTEQGLSPISPGS